MKMPRESSSQRKLAIQPLADYFRARLLWEGNDESLANHGDVLAARRAFEKYRSRRRELAFITRHREDTALLITLDRLLHRVLAQDDAAISRALGFHLLRKSSAHRVRDRALFYALQHAMEGMGMVRSRRSAATLLEAAMKRVKEAGSALSAETILKIHARVQATDPGGVGLVTPDANGETS